MSNFCQQGDITKIFIVDTGNTGSTGTDIYVTGGTYFGGTLTLGRNDGVSISIPGFLTGSTSADIYVTGGTYFGGTLTLGRNDGVTIPITGFSTTSIFTGNTSASCITDLYITNLHGCSPITIWDPIVSLSSISATTYYGDGSNLSGIPDYYVTGGTYSNGTLTLNRQNGSLNVTGFLTGGTGIVVDTYVTGFTYLNNNLSINQNQGQLPLTVNISIMTGLTINGSLSASTYLGLPIDPDYYVTGGTYSNGSLTLNRQNGSVTIPGFLTGITGIDTYVTGFTYNDANRLTISQNGGQPPLNVFINTFTGITTHYLDVNTNVTETSAVGRLNWNNTDGTLDLGLKGGNVTLQIGQEQVVRVVNKTGANLLESQYKVARIRSQAEGGSQGQRLAIVLAQANNDPNSVDTLGIVTENINNNQEGFITSSGLVRNINTTGSLQSETWLDGDVLYLSPITAGELTKVKPIAPQHTVIMGYVVYAHVNNGKIFVKVDNGYELDELHNVRISGETNNQVLSYDSTQDVWVNRTLPAFITGFTDNFVTGGTYSSGTLTLNRQNGSVIITGFTTSSSSGGTGIDTYVTGFTYSNNNLSINQNQGQSPLSVTINNFTGLTVNGSLSASTYLGLPSFTFTGNTSASCISNLYVSNVYGCSPITIHDSIKSVGSSATGITSFAFGDTTVAAGDYSHAEGESTQAIGNYSHAEGSSTITTGTYSHAEGDSAQAIGGYSHAEGYLTKTIGDYSHTEGNGTLTGQYFYTTIGVSSGVITLDGTYGDVSTEFTTTGIILEDSGTFTWYQIDQGTPPYFDGTKTIITLTGTSVNSGTNVGIPGVFQPTVADILLGSLYSHTEGEGTIAIGYVSHAEGKNTTTIGAGSHAEGGNKAGPGPQAIGDFSHAEGDGTTAQGEASHAEGLSTTAIGGASHAEGKNTTATGDWSHVEGNATEAIGGYSHAEGTLTIAEGTGSHAEGESTTSSGVSSHAEGGNTEASGLYSHTEGVSTNASGTGSHAEGSGGKNYGSIGDYSHTEGRQTTTNGNYSHAEGYLTSTNVKGLYSHAEGHGSQAGDIGSHAEGYFTQANGNYSHSQGTNTVAGGDYSFASGSGSTAQGALSFVHSINSVAAGEGTVVLGGVGISGTTPNMVYVSTLNINSTPVSNSGGTQVLVRNSSTGNIEYRDSSTLGGGTGTDTYVTGFTYSNNNLSINQNQGQLPLTVTINNFTGLTINGSLSASTYLGLPSNIYETSTDGAVTSASTSNVYTSGVLVPANSFTTGNNAELTVRGRKIGTAGNMTMRVYINTINSISGSPILVATNTTAATNQTYLQFQRFLSIKSTGTTEVFSNTGGSNIDWLSSNLGINQLSVNWANDLYIVVATQCTVGTDSINARSSFIKIKR